MHHVIASAWRAFRGLTAPGMGLIFFVSLLASLATLVGLAMLLTWGLGVLLAHYHITAGFWLWLLGGTFGSWLLLTLFFPLMMPVLVSFFDEAIADRIERDAYPALAIGTAQPFWDDLRADVGFTLKAVALNLLILPLFIFPPLHLPVYYALNAYLLGTQFFMMAGGRHIGKPAARALAGGQRGPIMIAGLLITLCAQIPVLNLIAPFWGVALMVHLYQRLNPVPVVLPPVIESI